MWIEPFLVRKYTAGKNWPPLLASTRVLHYSASHFHDYEWCHCIFQWQYIEKWSPFSNSSLMHCFTLLRRFISQKNTLHWLPYLVLVDWIQVNCHFYYFTQKRSSFSFYLIFQREYVQNMFRMTMLKKIYIKSPSSANKVSNDKDHYLWKWRYNVLAIEKKSATIDLTDLILKVLPIGTYFCRKEDSCPNRAE